MKEINEDELALDCISLWGTGDQIRQTIEECGELIVKLAKYRRNVNGSTKEQICEEIADVEIMCKQMRFIFNGKTIDEIKKNKLERLRERLDNELRSVMK